jgi:hypothetical protein
MTAVIDQSGTFREWVNTYLGPSIGWIMLQAGSVIRLTVGGTYTAEVGVPNFLFYGNTPLTFRLLSVIPTQGTPYRYGQQPIRIVDAGGHAGSANITIQPFGSETINGAGSIVINTNFGALNLLPDPLIPGWVTV